MTRCQIQFKDDISKAQIYQHWDGYPNTENGVIKELVKFKEWMDENKEWYHRFNASYLAANYIYFEKKQVEKEWKEEVAFGFGVGVPGEFHGDEEYFYVISKSKRKNEWKVEVYSCGPHREKFLLFSGDLSKAKEKFVEMSWDELYNLRNKKEIKRRGGRVDKGA